VSPSSPGAAVSIQGLTRVLGGRSVLAGVELEAQPGSLVTVVGRSGCGKTTLLRLIAGLDRPDAGSVLIDGADSHRAQSRIRMVFQDARLLPWKRVLENVMLGQSGQEARRRAAGALARVGLQGREHDWPLMLSGGEKQRLALARALVSRPGLLLLDEPLGALDAFTRLEMQLLVERIWREAGFSALLVTHDVHEAVALGDVVVSLKAGKVALVLPVELPRPRERQSAAFNRVVGQVLEHLLEPDIRGVRSLPPSSYEASGVAGPIADSTTPARLDGSAHARVPDVIADDHRAPDQTL
jgi:sulfonate transport system ATP-binding protein